MLIFNKKILIIFAKLRECRCYIVCNLLLLLPFYRLNNSVVLRIDILIFVGFSTSVCIGDGNLQQASRYVLKKEKKQKKLSIKKKTVFLWRSFYQKDNGDKSCLLYADDRLNFG